jgi:predicted dienelactone hydrolase
LLLFVVASHLVWEGAHWQMAPAYLAVLLTVLLLLSPGLSKLWRIFFEVKSLLLTVLACGLSYVFPVFELPAPTGSFAIGTRIVSLVDASRTEDALPGDRHQRELIVQIWYPATPSHNARAPYRRRSETSLASSYQSVDWMHSRYEAPLANANAPFPILLYNPGWNGRRTQNTALIEELASHGHAIAAIDHPYNSGPVALADGRVISPFPRLSYLMM